jgi:hypothetical protein
MKLCNTLKTQISSYLYFTNILLLSTCIKIHNERICNNCTWFLNALSQK